MTSISGAFASTAVLRYSAFQDNAALRILSGPANISTTQDEVDAIVDIIRSSAKGNFEIEAEFDGAVIDTTDGDDSDDSNISIRTFDDARITTGGGNDDIGTYDRAVVKSGAGNDRISTYSYGTVSAGAGDDYIYGYSYMTVDAGDGNDEIRTSGHATIDAGNGDDLVVTLGYSTVRGGAGNDTLLAFDTSGDHDDQVGNAVLYGGEGDDDIQIGRNSVANGGLGNDTVTLMREGSTVEFLKGDGRDRIFSEDDFVLSVSGYTKDDVTVAVEGNDLVVTFAGSDDALRINLRQGKAATMSFYDGSTMTLEGANTGDTFSVKSTSPEWGNKESFWVHSYSSMSYSTREERMEDLAPRIKEFRARMSL